MENKKRNHLLMHPPHQLTSLEAFDRQSSSEEQASRANRGDPYRLRLILNEQEAGAGCRWLHRAAAEPDPTARNR
jgi:hypothetical protein